MNIESVKAMLDWIAANPGWMGLVVFLTALSESLAFVGLIVPGAMLMVGFGALIASGHLEFGPVYGCAALGAIAGDGLSFWLGRVFHQRMRQLWPFTKHPETLARGEDFFHRHGGKSVLLGRFFGPIRAVIPAVAGMLDMPVGKFVAVNVISALLWALAYLLPGMVGAASMELASQVAVRLVVLIVLVAVLLWFTVLLVRSVFLLLHPRVSRWLQTFLLWGRQHPLIQPISASLLDPNQDELRGLATLSVFSLGCIALLALIMNAVDHNLPTALDQGLYRFLQGLRTPWADSLMVSITELGDYPVKLTVALVVFAWLYWRRCHSAAWHWLAVLALGLASNSLISWLLQIPRPVDLYPGIARYSFPSNHATLTTILFGYLAVLIARETQPAHRWIPYLTAAFVIIPIAFSRLYLGAHWLSDALAGLSLGLLWTSLLGLAYNRHPAARLDRRGLLLISLAALSSSYMVNMRLHHVTDLQRYQMEPVRKILSQEAWWQEGWQHLPRQRLDFKGQHRQGLALQWTATETDLRRRLLAAGWHGAPPLTLQNSLAWLNPQAQLSDFPVLPQVHDGRHASLTLTHAGDTPASRWVLRFWDSGWRLQDGNVPVWVGSFSLQGLARRLPFFSLTIDLPYIEVPRDLIAPALHGLRVQMKALPGLANGITLITH